MSRRSSYFTANRSETGSRVRVFNASDIARDIAETFKDRPVEYEEVLDSDWPEEMQHIGDSLGIAYASDKWKPKRKSGKRDWEIYKHIAESRNRIFVVPGIIFPENDRKNKLRTIGPMVSFASDQKSVEMPEQFAILGLFKEANVVLHNEGTNKSPRFSQDDERVVTLSVKHGMLGASKMMLDGKLTPFLFVYTPNDGVHFLVVGDELDIEKDGIVG